MVIRLTEPAKLLRYTAEEAREEHNKKRNAYRKWTIVHLAETEIKNQIGNNYFAIVDLDAARVCEEEMSEALQVLHNHGYRAYYCPPDETRELLYPERPKSYLYVSWAPGESSSSGIGTYITVGVCIVIMALCIFGKAMLSHM
ncbi:hypothetical protein BSP36_027 [Bacillus phage BSP36]|nr:hypothetical protein BSP36_027 [Bacillus phage BSP36]